ncbi:MAG: hypothetical protein ACREQN_13330 [Candidatus Binataceae bacterium]
MSLRAETDSALAQFGLAGFGLLMLALAAMLSFGTSAHAATMVPDGGHQLSGASAGTLERQLADRGLIGLGSSEGMDSVVPPVGVEVDETVQTAKNSGVVISRTKAWNEELDGDTLQIEVTSFPSRQHQIAFWLLPPDSHGCKMFGRTMYDTHGRALKSEFWRNDQGLKITGAADFPSDLYPEAVPAVALPRVLDDSMSNGAAGTLNQQITPYGYVDLQVRVKDAEEIETPAGKFSAVKVNSQADVATLLPTWPHFLLRVVGPFIPHTTYYFQTQAPYRLLREEQAGTPFIGGPEATTELVRYYVEGATADSAAITPPVTDSSSQ